MILIGVFTSTMLFKELSLKNTKLGCRCKLLDIWKNGDDNYNYLISARCFTHIKLWLIWKIRNRVVKGVKFQINYKYNVMSDGTSEVIK